MRSSLSRAWMMQSHAISSYNLNFLPVRNKATKVASIKQRRHRGNEYAYYSAAGKVEDTGNNVTPPKRMRRSCYNSKTDEEEH